MVTIITRGNGLNFTKPLDYILGQLSKIKILRFLYVLIRLTGAFVLLHFPRQWRGELLLQVGIENPAIHEL